MKGRKDALEAYRRGALEEALAIQRAVMALAAPPPQERDFLTMALLLHARKDFPAAATLADGVKRYPDSAEMHENLGVFQIQLKDFAGAVQSLDRALALGSQSLNVHDSLCNALARVGREPEALEHGRKSLQGKDARFGGGPVLGTITAPPPPFDPMRPAENVISYVLWGEDPRYHVPLHENLRVKDHLFPSWTIRVYVDRSMPENLRKGLQQAGAQVIVKEHPPGQPPARRLVWRYDVLADPNVKRYLIRDADSLLTIKERVAVDDWLRSDKHFHLMRDFRTHTDLVLAGLWGGVGGILPAPAKLWEHFKPWRMENDHVDQDLLTVTVWPTLRQSCLIHDSVFTGCLGSVPFPPYGALPPRHHVGQNAFIHFQQKK
jgi:hypothetical protein